MANPDPNEDKIFADLKTEKVFISAKVWTYIFVNIADILFSMELEINSYLERDKAIPIDEIKKILRDVMYINKVFQQVLYPTIVKNEDQKFILIKTESENLDKRIRHLLSHHTANDITSMQMILGVHLDEKEDLGREDAEKIVKRIGNIRGFLDKLKNNTETPHERMRHKLIHPLTYLNYLKAHPTEGEVEKIERVLKSLDELNETLKKDI